MKTLSFCHYPGLDIKVYYGILKAEIRSATVAKIRYIDGSAVLFGGKPWVTRGHKATGLLMLCNHKSKDSRVAKYERNTLRI